MAGAVEMDERDWTRSSCLRVLRPSVTDECRRARTTERVERNRGPENKACGLTARDGRAACERKGDSFNIQRIKNLTANPLKVQPAVNQVELSYLNPQPELLAWSKANGLLLEAYSPLGSSAQVKETLKVPEVQAVAKRLNITPAQALISWHVQRGTVVLPKSVTPSRVRENFNVTALPDDLFDELEKAATSHPPQPVVNPSKPWGLDFDVFDDYPQ